MQQNATGNEINEELQKTPSLEDSPKKESGKKRFRPVAICSIAIVSAVVLLMVAYWFTGEVEAKKEWATKLSNAFGGEIPKRTFENKVNNGFDLSQAIIPEKEVLSGGPPKDGIPAITNPKLISVKEAVYLNPDDRIIGFVRNKVARAYPLKVLNYHEIVNDQVDDIPLAVTYCPLCDSAVIFDRRTELGESTFGVSGLLFNSNVLMYDRTKKTQSLWSQVKAKGVSGPGAGKSLKTLPVELTTWSNWINRYSGTKVLSSKIGFERNYRRSPYKDYFSNDRLMFPASPKDKRLGQKEKVLGIWTDKTSRAYPVSAFSSKKKRLEDKIDGKNIVVEYDPKSKSLRVVKADTGVEWMYSLWFAWYAFHPETELFE